MKRTHLALILLILCLIGIAACGTAAAANDIINVTSYHNIDIYVTDDDGKPIDDDGNFVSSKPQKTVKVDTILLTWNARAFPNDFRDHIVIIAYNSEIGYKYDDKVQINCIVANYTLQTIADGLVVVGYDPDKSRMIFTGTSDQIAIIIRGGMNRGLASQYMNLSQMTVVLEDLNLTSDYRSPISVENNTDITFELSGTTALRGGTGTGKIVFIDQEDDPEYANPVYDRAGKAGLNVEKEASITIKSKISEKGTLIAYGGKGQPGIEPDEAGNRNGAGGGGAGIGTRGAYYEHIYYPPKEPAPTSGNITIENSIIYAIGGEGGEGQNISYTGAGGAGIGGGGSTGHIYRIAAKAGNITIKDNNEIYAAVGKIAHGENTGPAIGGGSTTNLSNNRGTYAPGCSLKIEGENTSIITFSGGFGTFDMMSNGVNTNITLTEGNILQFDGGNQFVEDPNEVSLFPITYIVKDQNGKEIPGVKITIPAEADNFTSTYTRPAMTDEKIAEIERIMELTGTRSLDRDKTYLFGAGSATVWGEDETGGITFTAPGYVDYTDTVYKIDQKYYTGYVDYYTKWEPRLSYGQVIEITMTPLMVQYESESGSEDGNSFIGETHTVLDIAGAGITAPAGQVFDRWSGSDGKDYTPTDTIALTDVLTLTAQWTTPAYTVQYESDSGDADGTLDPAGTTYTVLDAVAADVTAPKGMVFEDWLDSDGITHYVPGQIITLTEGLVLTAQWITPPYTVQYESDSSLANGILDPAGTAYVVLDVAASGIPIPGGVVFDSWLGSDDVSYNPGDTIPMSTSFVLTAQWVTASYTVQYESDAGELDGKSYASGAIHTARGASEADVMGPAGKVFDKWLGSDGNTYVSGSKITVTSDLVLTAQWKTLGGSGSSSGGSSSGGGSGSAKITGGTTANVTPSAPIQPSEQSQNNNNNNQNNNQNAPQTIIQQMEFDDSKLIRTIAIVGLISGLIGSIVGGALISVVGRRK